MIMTFLDRATFRLYHFLCSLNWSLGKISRLELSGERHAFQALVVVPHLSLR